MAVDAELDTSSITYTVGEPITFDTTTATFPTTTITTGTGTTWEWGDQVRDKKIAELEEKVAQLQQHVLDLIEIIEATRHGG